LQFGGGNGVQNFRYRLKKTDFIQDLFSNQLSFDFPE
jgi:hypothetical protein